MKKPQMQICGFFMSAFCPAEVFSQGRSHLGNRLFARNNELTDEPGGLNSVDSIEEH
jgi:hypothetical protein